MDKVLNYLLEVGANGNMFAVAIIMAVAIAFNLEKIFRFIDSRKKVKINLIEESLSSSHIKGNTKVYLEGLIETEYFKSITGMTLEKQFREAILHAHKKSNGELSFKHFKRALPYIEFKDSKLSINISKISVLGFIYNIVVGFLMLVSAFFFFVAPAFSSEINLIQASSLYALGIFMSLLGGAMMIQALPLISAKKVRVLLREP